MSPKSRPLAIVLLAGGLSLGVAGIAQPAVAAFCGTPAPLWVNSGEQSTVLRQYTVSADGSVAQASQVPLSDSYGDIAMTPSGVLYGVTFDATPDLVTLSTADGTVTASVPVTFSGGGAPESLNALSVASDGWLYASAADSDDLQRRAGEP